MTSGPETTSGVSVLVVCTANVCRSPAAAALLAHQFATRGIAATVRSAGTHQTELGVDTEMTAAILRRGLDIRGHQPRTISPAILRSDGADLILTMTREQLRCVVTTTTGTFPRAFTVREFARRASTQSAAGLSLGEWVAGLGRMRRAAELLGDDPQDDVVDPYGRGPAMVEQVATELENLCRVIALAGPWPSLGRSDETRSAEPDRC